MYSFVLSLWSFCVRIISRKVLRDFWKNHPRAESPLRTWEQIVENAEWNNLVELKRTFPSADYVKTPSGRALTIFNIGGNNYRLIASIHYNTSCLYIRSIMTHDEYDDNNWNT
jgi:mRNA interferase HigB